MDRKIGHLHLFVLALFPSGSHYSQGPHHPPNLPAQNKIFQYLRMTNASVGRSCWSFSGFIKAEWINSPSNVTLSDFPTFLKPSERMTTCMNMK